MIGLEAMKVQAGGICGTNIKNPTKQRFHQGALFTHSGDKFSPLRALLHQKSIIHHNHTKIVGGLK